jgi:hypothetical protein
MSSTRRRGPPLFSAEARGAHLELQRPATDADVVRGGRYAQK